MRKTMVCTISMLLATASWAGGQESKAPPLPRQPEARPAVKAALEKLKSLAGDWLAAAPEAGKENQVAVSYRVTSGGSVVQETLFPGQPEEMLTTYCIQNGELILTHYCMLANQPQMKLDDSSSGDKMVFKFIGGANIDASKDMHMHDATLVVSGPDAFTAHWTSWADGKPDDSHAVAFQFKRKK